MLVLCLVPARTMLKMVRRGGKNKMESSYKCIVHLHLESETATVQGEIK